jgi:putative molybdopterin biosynthesis protein
MKRRIYLKMHTLEDAKRVFLDEAPLRPLDSELIRVEDSSSRVTSSPVFAKISSPQYHSSAMDGIVVRSTDTIGVSEVRPKVLILGKDAEYINTGDPIPSEFDAVIMIENVHKIDDNRIEIREAAKPWQHIRIIGEDLVKGELILPSNHKIRAQDIGAMLAGGVVDVEVYKKPKVCIVPTGSELVEPGERLEIGNIIEFNSRILSDLIKNWGGEVTRHEILDDDYDLIKNSIESLIDKFDIILIIAGSSAGSEDYTPSIIEELGSLLVHGVCIMPGKPVALGIIGDIPIVGIPGYPVSAIIAMEEFVKPLIFKMLGLKAIKRRSIKAKVKQKIQSKVGMEERIRVNLGYFKEKEWGYVAVPLKKGSGIITSMVRADGILRVPKLLEGFDKETEVEVELLRDEEIIKKNILLVGSHDNALEILQNELKVKYQDINLLLINVGSLGGLMAMKRGETHITGIHLLDTETGEYNIPFVKKILSDLEVILINLVYREQGLILKRGNPKKINGLEDLIREDVHFINRQRGAGTRVLLDYKLGELNLDKSKIKGYDTEVFTHLAVSAAVKDSSIDVGLGIRASSNVFGLDFIPIAKERYDLVIPKVYYELENIQKVIEIIRGEEFKKKVEALGGYDTSSTGEVIFEG